MPLNEPDIMCAGFTHKGKVRNENEDSLRLCNPEDEYTAVNGYLYGIADGMGGYALGEQASSLALETFFDTFYDSEGASPLQKIKAGMQNANLTVYQTAQKLGVGRMGTTLTAINIVGNNLYIGHIGDTRAYRIRNNKIHCLTQDHTRVGELVRLKVLAKDKVRSHSQRSILEKCLGFNLFAQPDVFKETVQADDVIIMCTDGVWAVIEDEEFADLTKLTTDPIKLSNLIGQLALDRDHDDNLSVIVVSISGFPQFETSVKTSKLSFLPGIFNRFIK